MSVAEASPELPEDTSGNSPSFDKERDHMHRRMLSSVSHDLRTPLVSIIGSLEVYEHLQDTLPPDKQAALIHVALQEAYRLDNFITNILDMARLESGLVAVQKENTRIGDMLQNCVERLSNLLQGCTVTIKPAEKLEGTTDPVLLSRVICLVLDNAVKYGGTPPVIHIGFGQDQDKGGFISVQDNGRGIPPIHTEAVFEKYARFEKNAGTGLGLAICREIMRLLDGRITTEHETDSGARFTLYFPMA